MIICGQITLLNPLMTRHDVETVFIFFNECDLLSDFQSCSILI